MDNPNKTMEETIKLIKKGLEDITKNKATKAEVHELINDRVTIDKEVLANMPEEMTTLKSENEEFKTTVGQLQSQIKQLRTNRYTALKNSDGSYNGMFANPAEAKAFGLIVMAGATANKSVLSAKHDAIKTALDNIGLEPNWLNEKGLKIMTGTSQAGGSALITTEMIPNLIALFEQYGVFEANALAVPMGAGSTLQPKTDAMLDLTCPGEGGTIDAGDPSIALISHTLKTLCAMTAYSMELDEDSAIELGEMLAFLFVRSYGYGIDKIGFLGDGTSTYFGMTGITGALKKVDDTIGNIKSLVVGTGNAYSELVLNDFTKVIGTLPDFADDGFAKWYMHRYFYYTVFIKLALASSGATASEVVLGASSRQKTAMGYPVQFTQVMPKAEANSQICALLANLKVGAQIGRRGVMEVAESSERYFEKALIAVRARRRISINCHGVGDTTDAGPICGLITAGS